MNVKVKNLSSGISIVQINDPKTYNSLSFKNLTDLIKVFKKLDGDKKTKVIIIEGAGKGFSAGHNLKEVKNLKLRNKYQKLFNLCSKLMLQIIEGRKPVIAKVHGAAYAAGCRPRAVRRGGRAAGSRPGRSAVPVIAPHSASRGNGNIAVTGVIVDRPRQTVQTNSGVLQHDSNHRCLPRAGQCAF